MFLLTKIMTTKPIRRNTRTMELMMDSQCICTHQGAKTSYAKQFLSVSTLYYNRKKLTARMMTANMLMITLLHSLNKETIFFINSSRQQTRSPPPISHTVIDQHSHPFGRQKLHHPIEDDAIFSFSYGVSSLALSIRSLSGKETM